MRFCSDIEPQGPFSAALAALTAASTSFSPASATMPITLLLIGLRFSYHLSVATYSPSMKLRILSVIMISPVAFRNVCRL